MKHGKWIVAGMFLLLLGLEVIQETSRRASDTGQGGGGVAECECATQVATATQQMVISPTPLATPTDGSVQPSASLTPYVWNTPTIVPPGMTHTPDPADCPGYPMAGEIKGMEYTLTYGPRQFIRSTPDSSRNDNITGYLYRDRPRQAFFTTNGWLSLNRACTMFVWSGLGTLLPIATD